MRILMLAQFYPPIVGGEERFVYDLSVELAARQHTVSVVTLWHKGFPEFEIDHGVRIYRVRSTMQRMSMLFSEDSRQYAPPFPDPEVLRALRRIILEERPDIVHAHNWLVHSFTPLKKWSKAKFIVSLHDYSHVCVQKRLMRQDICCTGPGLKKCLACSKQFYGLTKGPLSTLANFYWGERQRKVADMFLPVSQAVVEGCQLDKHHVPYKVISNFVPDQIDVATEDDNPFLAQLPEGDFLLFVGDVTFDKGAETLLQAYAKMDTQIPLVLIGRPLLQDVAERFPEDVLRRVFMLGRWPHDAVMGAWSRCTVGLVPSIVAETFGIVALEAMYTGKPVIAARNGGLTDVVVENETGLLVTPGYPQALQTAIQFLLDNPELRASMGASAKQRAMSFRAKEVIPRFEQIYQELLGDESANELVMAESK